MVRPAVCFAFAVMLSACATPPSFGPEAEDFGDAVRHNIAVQTLNPEGVAPRADPSSDGSRAALAVGRYKTDQVKRPVTYSTSSVSTKTTE